MNEKVIAITNFIEGAIFELTLDGSAPENKPMGMLELAVHHVKVGAGQYRRLVVSRVDSNNQNRFKHTGMVIDEITTRRFKLVSAGDCLNLDIVLEKLAAHGRVPEGQWIQAVKFSYPFSCSVRRPIGIADPSWVNSHNTAYFPGIFMGGCSLAVTTGYFSRDWLWMVEVPDEKA